MGPGIARLFIVNLSQSPDLKVLRESHLTTVLRSMEQEHPSSLDAATAVDMARRSGAVKVLVGSFDKEGDVLSVEVQLIDVASSTPLAKTRAEGHGLESLFATVNKLTEAIKKDLAIAAEQKADASAWTTTSIQAYEAFAKGMDAFNRFNSTAGMVQMHRAVDIDSTFSLAYAAMAIDAYGLGDIPRATSALSHALLFIDRLPTLERILLQAIESALREDFDLSFNCYQQLRDLGIADPNFHLGLAQLYYTIQDYKSAESLYANILRQDPKHLVARIMMGLTQLQLDRKDLAEAELKKALQQQPDNPYVHIVMSQVYASQRRLEEAEQELRKASQLDSEDPWVHNLLGYFYLSRNKMKLALEEFQRYLALAPNDPNAHDSMAEVYMRMGNKEMAEREYLQALKLKPDFANPHYMLGLLYQDRGENDRATESYKEYLRLSPSGPLSKSAEERLEELGYW